MITDIFAKRYPAPLFWHDSGIPPEVGILLTQLTHLVMRDLLALVKDREAFCRRIHDQLAREVGVLVLESGASFEERCGRFLTAQFDVWNNSHQDADAFVKARLSLAELAFRQIEANASGFERTDKVTRGLLSWAQGKSITPQAGRDLPAPERSGLDRAVEELNARFLQAGLQLHYHSGVIQKTDDDLTTKQVAEPFWALVRGEKWENVELDMKEAIDRRDSGGRDAALYALKALESVIKIISTEKGWTRGNEKGAANFVDNLVSEKNGRFVDVWEGEALKELFSTIRNPHGHGPGSSPMPALPLHQQTWAIEASMSWIKSLLHRV